MNDQLETRIRRTLDARADRVPDDLDPPPLTQPTARPRTTRTRWLAVSAASLAVVVVAVTVTLLASRSPSRQPATSSAGVALAGTSWLITAVTTPAGTTITIPAEKAATIAFPDSGHAAGSDAVNNWQATYTLRGSTLAFQSAMIGLVGGTGGDPVGDALVTGTQALLGAKAIAVARDGASLTLAADGYTVHLAQRNGPAGG